ncbi:ABC transporter ATP-binding protein [Planctomicrobium sp. SH668]|uniref:ABC transporter ATP-binding protein n=1 Tax=Planctomicrobium sp. SH668 TaxID=3448126 RepID=UPI003F5C18C0
MEIFPKLWPYLQPHRTKIGVSIVLGFIIAALWGANLTVAFPIVKLLLEDTSLHEYVDQTIATATAEKDELIAEQTVIAGKLAALEAESIAKNDEKVVDLQQSLAKKQNALAGFESTIYRYNYLKLHLMPFIPKDSFETFKWLVILLILATAVKAVLMYIQDVLIGNVAESAIMGLRKDMLDRTLDLDYQSLSHEGPSGLMSRFTYDAEQLSQGITLLGGRMIREPLKCIACMVLAIYFNWRLTLLSLIFIPLLGLFLSRVGWMLKRASRRMMESMSQIYKVLEETFDGIKVVVGYNNGNHHRKLFAKQYDAYFGKAMKVVRIDAAAKPLLELLGIIAMFAALVPGAYLVMSGKTDIWGIQLTKNVMDGAELGLIYALLAGLLDPCRRLSGIFPRLKKSAAALDRIFGLMNQKSLIVDSPEPINLGRHSKSIEFRDVSFCYHHKNPNSQRGMVLEHVDLKVNFGEVVAIVGQNGCGKSTLVNLLPRYYDPEAGDVFIDGHPMKDVSLDELRSQVGIVTQDTVLFDGTLMDNIRYGNESATRAEVEEAARRAHVMPIVQSLPQGFDTMLGGKGKDLSGGQRQRVALARVILRNPAILILDEATSAADPESESLLHQALKEFVKGRTTFLISHMISQSLLDFVTRIVVMENGKVVASGSHQQLLETCPLYHRLYHSPSRQLGVVSKAA